MTRKELLVLTGRITTKVIYNFPTKKSDPSELQKQQNNVGGLADAKVFAQQSRELTEQRVLELKDLADD